MEYGNSQDLPISHNIVKQMSFATIKNFNDALVELITNSDDSYKRLEHDNMSIDGQINIQVKRAKGGLVNQVVILDNAEGMNRVGLEKAIKFAEIASGLKEGMSVRGYFGRGLKESVISLGRGRIDTIKNGIYDSAELWWDEKLYAAQYHLLKQPMAVNAEIRASTSLMENGTVITIDVSNPKIKCPDFKTFKDQLGSHYSLRDINSSPNRNVKLKFKDWKGLMSEIKIAYLPPVGNLSEIKKFNLVEFGDEVEVKIFKSDEQLDSPRNNPYAKAGFLIKTGGAILDLQLFKYEEDEAGLYFFGDVFCPGMEKRLISGEQGLIDTNRGGLEWKSTYCHRLRLEMEKILSPVIADKKKELEKKTAIEINEKTKKILKDICNLLNKFAKDEIELAKDIAIGPQVGILMIKPEYANLEMGISRSFSLYLSKDCLDQFDKDESITPWSTNPNINLLCSTINIVQLSPHPKYTDLLYSHFDVIGNKENEFGKIICKIGEHTAYANVKVTHYQGGAKRGKTLSFKSGGLFSTIEADENLKPLQRVKYDTLTSEIRIFVNFPAVKQYIGPGLEGTDTIQGTIMLAELIGEAFCRQIAMKRKELGKTPYFQGSEIDTFNSDINYLQKKYLHHIHSAIVSQKADYLSLIS